MILCGARVNRRKVTSFVILVSEIIVYQNKEITRKEDLKILTLMSFL